MTTLPQFFNIDLDNFNQKLSNKLNDYRSQIKKICALDKHSWNTVMQPMEEMDDELSQFWSPISHLHSVVNSEALREVYRKAIAELSAYSTELGQNQALYQAIKNVKAENEIQQKILDDELLGFKLSGVSLEDNKKKRFAEIQQRLSELSTDFETNLLDATQAWKKELNSEALLNGLPEHAINTAKELGHSKGVYILTLDYPCFHAVMTYAEDQSLREEMYQAYVTRASELGPNANEFDNSTLIKEILSLKHEKALLLGFNNYAELSLATKMAPSTEKVMAFLIELAEKSQAQAKKEFEQLEQFAKQALNPWDIAYYSEKQQQHLFDI